MAAFNQSPLNQQAIVLGISSVVLGIGTINPINRNVDYEAGKSIILSTTKTLNSITIPIDLRPKVGLLYPR
jgi:hypothetical protein